MPKTRDKAVRVGRQSSELVVLPTGIDDLDGLLVCGENLPGGGNSRKGIACLAGRGLFGVIIGSAGTGKSILGLQLCFGFAAGGLDRPRSAIYVTHEPSSLVLAKASQFGLCSGQREPKLNTLEGLLGKRSTVHICEMPVASADLEKDQGQLIANVLDAAAQRVAVLHNKKSDVWQRLLICLDNVDMISPAALLNAFIPPDEDEFNSAATGSSRGQQESNQNIYKHIRACCARRGLNVFLICEENSENFERGGSQGVSSMAQAYAADIVLRLGVRNVGADYQERFLEIVKAKNQYYRRGRHHFSIVGDKGGRPGAETPNKGINIYPSVATQLSRLQQERRARSGMANEARGFGVATLDQRIQEALSIQQSKGYIQNGSVSVLVSDLDAKATELGLHFARNRSPALYISFLHDDTALRQMAGRFGIKLHNNDVFPVYFPPEHISDGKLLHDINSHVISGLRKKKYQTVVVDSLFEMKSRFPSIKDVNHFLEALVELLQIRRVTSLLIDMVEVGEGRNPIDKSVAAGFADNVFLLRHVEFESRPHRVFSVVKLRGSQTPDQLWDLVELNNSDKKASAVLVAADTFELYKNVLSGQPKPVKITLTLYRDEIGSPFDLYLKGQQEALKQIYGEAIDVNLYGTESYARIQAMLASLDAAPVGDCHVLAIDEFWLDRLIERDHLEDIGKYFAKRQGSSSSKHENAVVRYRHGDYITSAHDCAVYRKRKRFPLDSEWYAVPARNNAGIMCCHMSALEEFLAVVSPSCGVRLAERVRQWAKGEQNRFTWKDLRKLSDCWMRSIQPDSLRGRPQVFFTFCMDQMESCVSFLLELLLSHHPKKLPLVRSDGRLHVDTDYSVLALETLVGLLSEEDRCRLRAGRFRPFGDEPTALFSRHWMSTLGCLRARTVGTRTDDGETHRIPAEEGWFLDLIPLELPRANTKLYPTPVSGAWYLGVYKGSAAVRAGARVIEQFTSLADEIHKLNACIGLPVRSSVYKKLTIPGAPGLPLPYRKRYGQLADIQKTMLTLREREASPSTMSASAAKTYSQQIVFGEYPFSRASINDYERVGPMLWRLMQNAACVTGDGPGERRSVIEDAVKQFKREYSALR